MYVNRRETGTIKGGCHFDLTVDTLLTYDSHL